jgi:beta-glucosidase-like glycosyl hydrolase
MGTLDNTIEVSAESGTGFEITVEMVSIVEDDNTEQDRRHVVIESGSGDNSCMTVEQARAFAAALNESADRLERQLIEDQGLRLFEVKGAVGYVDHTDDTVYMILERVDYEHEGRVQINATPFREGCFVGYAWESAPFGRSKHPEHKFTVISMAKLVLEAKRHEDTSLFAEVAA